MTLTRNIKESTNMSNWSPYAREQVQATDIAVTQKNTYRTRLVTHVFNFLGYTHLGCAYQARHSKGYRWTILSVPLSTL